MTYVDVLSSIIALMNEPANSESENVKLEAIFSVVPLKVFTQMYVFKTVL